MGNGWNSAGPVPDLVGLGKTAAVIISMLKRSHFLLFVDRETAGQSHCDRNITPQSRWAGCIDRSAECGHR